jgi:hypothetical protein
MKNPIAQVMKAGVVASLRELGVIARVGYDAAYAEARKRNTLAYQFKTELANNAAVAAAGIEALRNYDPNAGLRTVQAQAIEDQQALEGKQVN